MDAGDSFDPFPPVPVPDRNLDHTERIIAVDGEERALTSVSYGNYAALRYRQGSVVVTAVARLGFPSALSFHVIDDLEPYFAGYRRFVLGFLGLLSTGALPGAIGEVHPACFGPGLGLALAVRPAGAAEAPHGQFPRRRRPASVPAAARLIPL